VTVAGRLLGAAPVRIVLSRAPIVSIAVRGRLEGATDMPTADVYDLERKKVGTIDLPDDIFAVEVRDHLFHATVRAQLAARRAGTAKTKERSEVAGARKKAWKQKGTGRARQGTRQAPHWRGGGTVHGPKPHDYVLKVNKKVRRAALCAALSRRCEEGRLVVLDSFELPEVKTKRVAEFLRRFEAPKALIVDGENLALSKSARNIPSARYLHAAGLNVYDILRHDTLFLTKAAVQAIEGRLGQ
jgi:large subunit ribosomal protein L4